MFRKYSRRDRGAVSTAVIAGAVITVVIVVFVAGFVLMGDGGGGGGGDPMEELSVGDYLRYDSWAASGDTTLNYIWWINVTSVSSTSYTIHETEYFNGFYYGEYNQTIAKTNAVNIIATMPAGLEFSEQTTIDTAFGTKQVMHYWGVHSGEYLDFYFGVDNGVLYRYHYALGGTTGEYNLVDTNLDWV